MIDRDRLARLCAQSCRFAACTGKGSTARWSHRCKLAPDLVVELGPCAVAGCDAAAVTTTPAGRRCGAHLRPQPVRGYCAPNRCYCPTPTCGRPA